jgi:flagellar motility protein MotE (MotC chaperone)
MIPAWLTKASTSLIIVAVAMLATASIALFAVRTVDDFIDKVRSEKADERDAYWTARIEKMNANAANTQAAQVRETMRIETNAATTIAGLEANLKDLEKKNAALPNGTRGGLDRDRVRLLPH